MSAPNANLPNTSQMVGIYNKLFALLAVITLFGIAAVYFFHIPVWLVVTGGIALIAVKSTVVFESFKQFMVGRNILVMVFSLTGIFVLGLLLLPLFNHGSRIAGTVDTSKQILMETKEEPHHGH